MFFARRLAREEVYVTVSYSPIFAENGRTVEGVFCVCTETTERVLGERRLSILHRLGARGGKPHVADIACREAVNVLADNPLDIPFAVIYLLDDDGTARHVAGTPLPAIPSAFSAIHLLANAEHHVWPLAEVAQTREAVEVSNLPDRVGAFAAPLWPDLIQTALVIPLGTSGQSAPAGFLIVGLSPRRVLDASYRGFLGLVAEHIGTAIANARAFENERRRA